MKKILVIGSLNMDQALQVEHIPAAGETILCQDMQLVCGGKGANQAFTCGRLGCQVEMLGCVGRDENGTALIENLAKAGIETANIRQVKDKPTGTAVIAVEKAGNNCIFVIQGANLRTDETYIRENEKRIQEADAVVLQLEIPLPAVTLAAKLGRKEGKLVILDPAPATELPDELYRCVDIIKPNETELALLTGLPVKSRDEVENAARCLLKRGAKNVVVTLGEAGAMLVRDSGSVAFPGKKVEVADTTAAGDSFTAAMTMLLSEGYSLEQAISFAIEVAAIVVTRPGAQSSIPKGEEVKKLIPPKNDSGLPLDEME